MMISNSFYFAINTGSIGCEPVNIDDNTARWA